MADDAKGNAGSASSRGDKGALSEVESLIMRTQEWRRYARLYQHYRGLLLRLFGVVKQGG